MYMLRVMKVIIIRIRPSTGKNGQEVILTNGQTPQIASSIAVHKGDVYIAGTEFYFNTGKRVAKYWKNGQAVLLSDNGVANSIVVVQR